MVLAHRVCFRQGYALLFGLLNVTCHFGVADTAVLHDGLLAHFFNNNAVGDVLTDGGRRVFDVGVVRDNGFDFAIGRLDVAAFACLEDQGLVDHLCQNLLAQLVGVHLCAFRHGLTRLCHGLFYLTVGNDFVVDNRGNAV